MERVRHLIRDWHMADLQEARALGVETCQAEGKK